MTCDSIENDEIAVKYFAGHLSEAETEAYEAHYFGCPRCFSELAAVESLWQGLQGRTRRLPPTKIAIRQTARIWWVLGAAAAALILGVIGWSTLRHETVAGIRAPISTPNPAAPPPVPAIPSATALELLARAEPPQYRAPVLRGAASESETRFRAAMKSYQARDYASALPALEAASRLDPEAAGPRFFAGICQLLTGLPDEAIASFERVISLGESPYLEKAQFYKAKALLRKGNMAGATRALDEVVRLKGDLKNEASGLNQQLRELQRGAR